MMGFPYGFKPNKELDSFLGGCMISLLEGWKKMIKLLINFYGEIFVNLIFVIGVSLGFTAQVSLIHDIFLYLTAHLHFIYIFFSNIFRFFKALLLTLLKMFKGAKYNIWTKWNEVENFTVDELMLGIIIFLITLFLIPTIIMYYLCVVVIILVVVLFQIIVITFIKSIKHFPVYLILKTLSLKVKGVNLVGMYPNGLCLSMVWTGFNFDV